MTVVLAVRWRARPGAEEQVAALLARLAPVSRAEPGCLQYDPHRDPDDPRAFFLFERYVDEAALEQHVASEHFCELVLGQAVALLESRERVRYVPLLPA